MQLATLDREVTSSGTIDSKEQGIILDATMFTMLSDGLYSDKIGAAVREVYSNAMDSHRAAGKPDQPARVKLPTPLDPTFSVRDEGLGMDHEEVMNVAGEYGSSTKRDENDSIGGFGIGFNSPYAAADQWSIIAIKDHVRRTYSCFKNEHGRPCITQLSQDSTVEPNGVEVIIPAEDCAAWQTSVQQQLQWFPERPLITGGTIDWPEYTKHEVLAADDKTVLGTLLSSPPPKGGSYYYKKYKWHAFIGGVAIDIDQSKLDLGRHSMAFSRTDGVINFNVGELLPDPSREGLQYKDYVVKALQDRMIALGDRVLTASQAKIDAQPNLYEAYIMSGILAATGAGAFYRHRSFTYKDETLSNTLLGRLEQGIAFHLSGYDLDKDTVRLVSSLARPDISIPRRHIKKTHYMIDDLPNKNHRQGTRILQKIEELDNAGNKPSSVIVLRGADLSCVRESWAFYVPTSQVTRLSTVELPKIKRSASSSSGAPKAKKLSLPYVATQAKRDAYLMNSWCYSTADLISSFNTAPDTPDSGYYILSNNGAISKQVLALLALPELVPGDVYIVPLSMRSKVENNDKWLCFATEAREQLKGKMRSLRKEYSNTFKHLSTRKAVSKLNLQTVFESMHSRKLTAPAGTRSVPWRLYTAWVESLDFVKGKPVKRIDSMRCLPEFKAKEDPSHTKESLEFIQKMEKDYPLLPMLFYNFKYSRIDENAVSSAISKLF